MFLHRQYPTETLINILLKRGSGETMRTIAILCLLFMFIGLVFAPYNTEVKIDSKRESKSTNGEVRTKVDTKIERTTSDGKRETVRETKETRGEKTANTKVRIEQKTNVRERVKKTLENTTVDDALKRREALQKTRNIAERKCESVSDDNERKVCDKESVAYQAREKVRARHELNEECREKTGEERSACQRRINTVFKTDVQAGFKEWIQNRKVNESENETEDTEGARVRLELIHKKIKEERLKNQTEDKQGITNRLSNAIEKAEKHIGLFERAIAKAAEKGHDTERLEFMLESYTSAVDGAKVFFDDEQYRDSIASLHEAKELFKEFRSIFSTIVSKHKNNEHYVEAEISGEVGSDE